MDFSQEDETAILRSISEARSQLMLIDSTVQPAAQLAQLSSRRLGRPSPRSSKQVLDRIRDVIVPDREEQIAYIQQLEYELEQYYAALEQARAENAALREQTNQISKMNLTNQQKIQQLEHLQRQLELFKDFKQSLTDHNKYAYLEIQQLRKSNLERETEIAYLSYNKTSADNRVRELESSVASLQAQLAYRYFYEQQTCSRIAEDFKTREAYLNHQIRELEGEKQHQTSQRYAAESRCSALSSENEMILRKLEKQYEVNQNFDRNLVALNAQFIAQQDAYHELSAKFQAIQQELDARNSDFDAVADEAATWEAKAKLLGYENIQLGQLRSASELLAEQLKKQLSEESQKTSEAERRNAQYRAELDNAQQQTKQLTQQNLQLKQQLSQLLDYAQALQYQLNETNYREEYLSRELEERREERTKLAQYMDADATQYYKENEALSMVLEAYKQRVQQQAASIGSMNQQITDLELQLSEARAETAKLKSELAVKTQQTDDFNSHVDELTQQIGELNEQLLKAEEQLQNASKQNSALQNDTKKQESAHASLQQEIGQKTQQLLQMRDLIKQQNEKLQEIAAVNAAVLDENKQLARAYKELEADNGMIVQNSKAMLSSAEQGAYQLYAALYELAYSKDSLLQDVDAMAADPPAPEPPALPADETPQPVQESLQRGLQKQVELQRVLIYKLASAAYAMRYRLEKTEKTLAAERELSVSLQERQVRAQKENAYLSEQVYFYYYAKSAGTRQHRQLVSSLQAQIEHLKQKAALLQTEALSERERADAAANYSSVAAASLYGARRRLECSAASEQSAESRLAASRAEYEQKSSLLTRQVAELQCRNDELERNQVENLVPALNTRILQLETQLKQLEKDNSTYRRQIELLQGELAIKQEESAQTKGHFVQTYARLMMLERENKQLDSDEVRHVLAYNAELLHQNDVLRADGEMMRAKLQYYQDYILQQINSRLAVEYAAGITP